MVMHGDWGALLHPTWSPLYPALLAAWWCVIHPPLTWMWLATHALTLIFFCAALVSFEFYLRSLLRRAARFSPLAGRSIAATYAVSYAVFLAAILGNQTAYLDTPDMMVQAIIFFVAGLLLQSRRGVGFGVLLGIACGVGFLAKSVFLVLSVIVLICLLLDSAAKNRLGTAVAFAASFLLLSAPYIWALSAQQGHFTIGEVANITYATYGTLQYDFIYPSGPELMHPPVLLAQKPIVAVFDGPDGGTYPIWFDRTYWFDGMTMRFDPIRHLALLLLNAKVYFQYFAGMVIFALLFGSLVAQQPIVSMRTIAAAALALLFSLSGLFIYWNATALSAHWSGRYYAAFQVIFIVILVASLRANRNRKLQMGSTAARALLGVFFTVQLMANLRVDFDHGIRETPDDAYISQGLTALGLANDKLAELIKLHDTGDSLAGHNNAWAFLSHVRVVADIDGPQLFWDLPEQKRAMILEQLKQRGIRAVILEQGRTPPAEQMNQWQRIGRSKTYMHRL